MAGCLSGMEVLIRDWGFSWVAGGGGKVWRYSGCGTDEMWRSGTMGVRGCTDLG